MLTLRKVLPTLNTLLLYSPNYQPCSPLIREQRTLQLLMQSAQGGFISKRGRQGSFSVSQQPPLWIYIFSLIIQMTVEKTEEHYISNWDVFSCVVHIFLTVHAPLSQKCNASSLVLHKSAEERHFLQAWQSRQSNAEAFRAAEVHLLIHWLTMSSRKLRVSQIRLFFSVSIFSVVVTGNELLHMN